VPVPDEGSLEKRPLFCESRGAAIMARRAEWCYISWRGEQKEELYDLAADPHQARNIAQSSREQLGEMRGVLAELAMRAARGYRVAVVGPRTQRVEIELASETPLAYLDVPTIRERGAVTVDQRPPGGEGAAGDARPASRVSIRLPPGEAPHVVLFDPADPEAAVTVQALSDGRAVAADRFHLGERGRRPEAVPLSIGRAARALLEAEEPPVAADADEFAIWVWLPPGAAQAGATQQLSAEELPEELTEQLRSLGYLR
jgi:hypothetical protein